MTELYLIAPPDAEAAAFAGILKTVLAAANVSALLLQRGERSDIEYQEYVSELGSLAQGAGCAVLIEGEPQLAIDLAVDGLHVQGPLGAVKAAVAALKPDFIVGAGGIGSRHDAMAAGELGIDYIMFGPLSGATAPELRELAAWWAPTMEVPSVLSDPEATAEGAEAEGCEFFAVGESVWRAPDPAAAVAAIAARLEIRP